MFVSLTSIDLFYIRSLRCSWEIHDKGLKINRIRNCSEVLAIFYAHLNFPRPAFYSPAFDIVSCLADETSVFILRLEKT